MRNRRKRENEHTVVDGHIINIPEKKYLLAHSHMYMVVVATVATAAAAPTSKTNRNIYLLLSATHAAIVTTFGIVVVR